MHGKKTNYKFGIIIIYTFSFQYVFLLKVIGTKGIHYMHLIPNGNKMSHILKNKPTVFSCRFV